MSFSIVFAGTPDFAVPALLGLIEAGHRVRAVYTQPDRAAGRGRRLQASPVKQAALEAGLAVEQPRSLKGPEASSRLAAYQPDFMVVAAYGLILPQSILDTPARGCLNVHASLLPRWRGAAPIQRAILAGDESTGITIMQMEAGLDTGPMLLRRECPIDANATGGSLHDQLARLGREALLEALNLLEGPGLAARAQDDARATYAAKLEKSEAWIDWTLSAARIERQVRAFNPWPVAQTRLDGEVLRIWRAAVEDGSEPGRPGKIMSTGREGIRIACGQGVLRVLEVQAAGRKRMSAAEFLNARNLDGGYLDPGPADRPD